MSTLLNRRGPLWAAWAIDLERGHVVEVTMIGASVIAADGNGKSHCRLTVRASDFEAWAREVLDNLRLAQRGDLIQVRLSDR